MARAVSVRAVTRVEGQGTGKTEQGRGNQGDGRRSQNCRAGFGIGFIG